MHVSSVTRTTFFFFFSLFSILLICCKPTKMKLFNLKIKNALLHSVRPFTTTEDTYSLNKHFYANSHYFKDP